MRTTEARKGLLGALGAALLVILAPAAQAAPRVVGHVVSASGDVVAERPGQTPRPLRCRDSVHEGERVVTGSEARAGLLLGDVLAQLGAETALDVGLTPAGTADLELQRGEVRVIDPRETGADARLGVLGASARVLGNDAEAYVFTEKAGAYAMLCEWDVPLDVARGAESARVEPGRCVVAKAHEPLYLAEGHSERLAAPGADVCPLGPVVGGLAQRFTPVDVAAGPPALFAPTAPPVPLPPTRSPCDTPGSGCAGGPGGGAPTFGGVVTPPPATGGGTLPGSGSTNPGVVTPPPVTGGGTLPGSTNPGVVAPPPVTGGGTLPGSGATL